MATPNIVLHSHHRMLGTVFEFKRKGDAGPIFIPWPFAWGVSAKTPPDTVVWWTETAILVEASVEEINAFVGIM